MSTWDEKAQAAAREGYAPEWYAPGDGPDRERDAFEEGARWQREVLLSDEVILRALNAEEPRAATDNLTDWGEQSIARMRRALTAATGDET